MFDQRKTWGEETIKGGLEGVLSVLIPAIAFGSVESSSAKRQKIAPSGETAAADEPWNRYAGQGDELADLWHTCVVMGQTNAEAELLRSINMQAEEANAEALHRVYMAFLKRLYANAQDHVLFTTTQTYQQLYRHIITRFALRWVDLEPVQPTTMVCQPRGCGDPKCRDCHDLDDFLRHSSREVLELTMAGYRRSHVEGRLGGMRCIAKRTVHATRGRSHTLRLTKALQKVWQEDHNAWCGRCSAAINKIKSLAAPQDLQRLLGDNYEDLMHLRLVRMGCTEVLPERPSPRGKGRSQVEIVDLTEY